MKILGIETSCDETAAAICVNGEIISSNLSSQEIHNKFGGVIPELASREHEKVLNLIGRLEHKENTHYLKGKQISNGKIPDFTFKLPDNKVVHVDCKFSTSEAGVLYESIKKMKENLKT